MKKENKKFLFDLLMSCGPSGFEEKPQEVWMNRTKQYTDKCYKDVMGNAYAVLNPDAPFKVMLASHNDEIGFIVSNVNDKGYIYIQCLGGIDRTTVTSSEVWIHSGKNIVKGVIGKKAIHLETENERFVPPKVKDVYIDIGAKSKKEVLKKISIGDPVTFAPNITELGNDIIASKACDDRAGCYIISEVIRKLSEIRGSFSDKIGVYAVATVQEEVGLRGATTGAFGVNPNVGIAIDVTHSSDVPGFSQNQLGDVKLGEGIVIHPGPANNRKLYDLVNKVGKKKKIKFQVQTASGPNGTDTAAIQLSRAGVATILMSIPNRYMHTQVETISLKDLDLCSDLIVQTILEMKSDMKFIPGV